ncbi:MAG: c-type cytochrome [Balneolaceae bacterium]
MKSTLLSLLIITTALFLSSCNGEPTERQAEGQQEQQEQGLTPFELEHGIGPVTERLSVGDDIDMEMMQKGKNIFEMKCEMCHNMEGRMVGPALGDVMERRSPEFVMNMILNPGEMARSHPEGEKMLREYMTVMPYQNVQEDEARAIVEYLRHYTRNNP